MINFTSQRAADAAGMHQQTVIKWSREGLVVPTAPRRKYEPRVYCYLDVVALMIARAVLDFGCPRREAREMVRLVQVSNRERWERAFIVAIESGRGPLVGHRWFSDVKDPVQSVELAKIEQDDLVIRKSSFDEFVDAALGFLLENYGIAV